MSIQVDHEQKAMARVYIDDEPFHALSETTGAALYALGRVEPDDLLYRDSAGAEVTVENSSEALTLHAEERFTTGRKKGRVRIIVNTRRRFVPAGRITYEQLPALAFDPVPTGPDLFFSITYRRGPRSNPQGELAPGGSVEVRNGMRFDVTPTNRS